MRNPEPDSHAQLTRRKFLGSSAAAVGLTALPKLPAFVAPPGKTKHVVLVAFAGGVRAKEVIGTPANVPNLMRIASQGIVMPNIRCENVGHYGAALSIFTGNVEYLGIRENEKGTNPTLFEYLRKDAGLSASDVWLSTAGGAQGRLFASSTHANYGESYAANVLDGDGIFNVEFKKVLDSFGRPRADAAKDRQALEILGKALDPRQVESIQGGKRIDPDQMRRVESFLLEELSGSNTRVTGPGAPDVKAIRIGLNLLRVFKPRVLGITLQSHDIAHGSFNGYVEVIRRNDEELGKLWDAIQQDPSLKDCTSIFVLPEFGRDKDLNQRNGLDHGDRSDEMLKVFLVAAGPDLKKNKIVASEARTIDVCPTVLSLFTKKPAAHSQAKVLKEIFA